MATLIFRIISPVQDGTIVIAPGQVDVEVIVRVMPALPMGVDPPTVTIDDGTNTISAEGMPLPNGDFRVLLPLSDEMKTGGARPAVVQARLGGPGQERYMHELDITWAAPNMEVAAKSGKSGKKGSKKKAARA